uniref:UPF0536 protein C12orf66 homolog n=1 Tax=Hirondellea gigas TaxID=1518452 RepID=A0A2P2I0R6_9CRUS
MERKEFTVLPAIFQQLAAFNYNKAKDVAEKERCFVISSGTAPVQVWPSFLSCLAQLAAVERLYMNLNLLTVKGFLRRENSVRASYECLLTELSDLETRAALPPAGGSTGTESCAGVSGLLWSLCSELLSFIRARICLIKFYESCQRSTASQGLLDYSDLAVSIADISSTYADNFTQPLLTALHANLKHECDVLHCVLQGMCSIQQYSFLAALLQLDAAHDALHSWQKLITGRESSKKYSFSSSFLKASSVPALYQWLWQVKAAATAKFSFYFYDSLAQHASLSDIKILLAKQSVDYVAKLVSFYRRVEATCVCLVLESSGIPDYRGSGYHLHQRTLSQPPSPTTNNLSTAAGGRIPPPPPPPPPRQQLSSGEVSVSRVRTFTRIFCYPLLTNQSQADANESSVCWASAQQFLVKSIDQLPQARDAVYQLYHPQTGYTHYLHSVEPLVTLVVSYDCHRTERESLPVRDFLNDISQHLNLIKLFAALKPK